MSSKILNEDETVIRFKKLQQFAWLDHLFSTRRGGVSEGEFSTMNLSFTRGDQRERVLENFQRIADILKADIGQFVFADQTHTSCVRIVTEQDRGKGITSEKDYKDVDALITNRPGVILCTLHADCVPVYFVDPVNRGIGLAHAGWRGTVRKICKNTVTEMEKAFGSKPEDLIAVIGPSICQDCYEVGEEVAEEFRTVFHDLEKEDLILKNGKYPHKYQLNLWEANRLILEHAGLKNENIEISGICTCCHADLLFSHRATGGRRGNLGAFITIKENA